MSPRTRYSKKEAVSKPVTERIRSAACVAALLLVLLASACKRNQNKVLEVAYVAAPQVNLRDRVSALYNKTGTLKNGERVDVLEKSKKFVRVKSASGETGWVEQRYLVGEDVYRGFEKLAAENRNLPVQAQGIARAALKIHLTPGRDTDSLVQLKEGDKVEVLKRTTIEKPQSTAPPKAKAAAAKDKKGKVEEPAVPMEDWSLARDAQGHTGWVLARMVNIDVPLDVAQYAEGQRIVAFFVLNRVHDEAAPPANNADDKAAPAPRDVAQYLVLLTEPKDGMPWDYNQARIFTWNLKRHRYETAYRERNLDGVFPVTTGTQDFGKEGTMPVFTLRVKDKDDGSVREKKYRLIGPIVRRVMTPQEEAAEKAARLERKKKR
jgi:SH3-like domain-containing protein